MRRLLIVLAAASLATAVVAPAGLAYVPTKAQLAKTMKREFAKQLHKQAPKLKVRKVTCRLGKKPAKKAKKKTRAATCFAHVPVKKDGVNVVYTIRVEGLGGGPGTHVSFKTTGHSCKTIKSGKRVRC